jgi:hypothetical protein
MPCWSGASALRASLVGVEGSLHVDLEQRELAVERRVALRRSLPSGTGDETETSSTPGCADPS